MSNVLEYILRIKDLAQGPLAKFGEKASKTFRQIEEDEKRLMQTNRLYGKSIDSIGASIDRLRAKARATQIISSADIANVRAMNSEIARLERMQNRLVSMNGSRLKTWAGDALNQIPGSGLIQNPFVVAAVAMGKSVATSMGAERTENSIKYSMGGDVGAQAIERIKQSSNRYGWDTQSMLGGAQTLFGSMKGYDPRVQMQLLEGVGKAASTLELGGEQAKGALLALGQIAGKGKVSMEELRQQLGERLPGAMQLAAKAMGVGVEQFNEMVENGLAANEFLPRFAKTLNDEFSKSAENNANSTTAQWNRLKGSLFEIADKLGKALLPIANKVFGSVATGMRWVADHAHILLPVMTALAGVWVLNNAGMLGYSVGANLARIANGTLIKSVIALGRALLLTPIGWVTLGLLGIMIALDALKKKFGSWHNLLDATKKIVSDFRLAVVMEFYNIGDAISTSIKVGVYKALDWLIRLGRSVVNFVKNPLEGFSWDDGPTKYSVLAERESAGREKRKAVFERIIDGRLSSIKNTWNGNNGFKGKGKGIFDDLQDYMGISSGSGLASGGGGIATGGGSSRLQNSLSPTTESITGGGARNVYITLGKFQDTVNVYVQGAKEGVDRVQELLEDALLRVLNGAGALQ